MISSLTLKADVSSDSLPESVELLDGGEQAYPRMLLAIARAHRNIYLEVYSFSPSGVGARFIRALGRAAERGVAVEVLIDGWGSVWSGRSIAATLLKSGCTVRIHNRLLALFIGRFGRNHRKILIADDEVAFLGGINIGDENLKKGTRLGWADLALEIRGPQCARLGRIFRHEQHLPIESFMQIHLCGPGGGWRLRRQYLKAFAGARKRIHIAHGYFLPDPEVITAITDAARRGVQVNLLLSGRSDVPLARAASRSLYRRLLAAGVTIHEWSASILHAKVATIDGCSLLVGSFNLDPFSLANLEALVEVENTRVAEQGEAWIHDHFTCSRRITVIDTKPRFRRWILDPLGRIASSVAESISRVVASRKRLHGAADSGPSLQPSNRSPSDNGDASVTPTAADTNTTDPPDA